MFNQFTGIGNLAADPEIKTTQSGTTIANYTVCCDVGWGDNKKTEFVRCITFGVLAEKVIARYAHKGMKVMIQGEMQTRSWEGQNGEKRYSTEIIVSVFKMLGSKGGGGGGQRQSSQGYQGAVDSAMEQVGAYAGTGEDVPF